MLDLLNYFPESPGAAQRIQAKMVFWTTVGKGQFTTITSDAVSFSGKGSLIGDSFDIKISLKLIDETNCDLSINDLALKGTYEESDGSVVVTISEGPEEGYVEIIPGSGGTFIYPHIARLNNIWIGP